MTNPRDTPPPPSERMGVTDIIAATHCESSEHYNGVLMELDERWRLIVCSQKYQVILQRRESLHGGAWRGYKYFRTKNALLKVCGGLGLLSDISRAQLEDALPPIFKNKRTKRAKI